MSKIEVMAVLEQFAAHQVTMKDAADAIEALYKPAEPSQKPSDKSTFFHGVECDKNGVTTVYHFSECADDTTCELFVYLDEHMEKHLKRGNEYWVTKNKSGEYIFEPSKKSTTKKAEPLIEKGTQASLL